MLKSTTSTTQLPKQQSQKRTERSRLCIKSVPLEQELQHQSTYHMQVQLAVDRTISCQQFSSDQQQGDAEILLKLTLSWQGWQSLQGAWLALTQHVQQLLHHHAQIDGDRFSAVLH